MADENNLPKQQSPPVVPIPRKFPPQYYDAEFCKRMAEYHAIIAYNYHEDGWLDEAKRHSNDAKWWRVRSEKILKGVDPDATT